MNTYESTYTHTRVLARCFYFRECSLLSTRSVKTSTSSLWGCPACRTGPRTGEATLPNSIPRTQMGTTDSTSRRYLLSIYNTCR